MAIIAITPSTMDAGSGQMNQPPQCCECYHKSGSPSHLGIAVLIVPSGSFFHAQTNVSVDITEELSPNVRMIRKIEPLAIGLHKSLASLVERLLQQTGGVSK